MIGLSRRAAVLLAIAAMAIPASAEGGTVRQIRMVPSFTSIVLDGVGTVRVKKGPLSVTVTIDEDLADSFKTEVVDGALKIGYRTGIGLGLAMRRLSTCEVDVSVPSLDAVTVNGSGKLSFDGFSGGRFAIAVNGAARVAGTVNHDALAVRITGAGLVELDGKADAFDAGCTGSAELSAGSMGCRAAKVSLSGSGRVELRVKDALSVSVSGSGAVRYWGSPELKTSVSGSGSVKRMGD